MPQKQSCERLRAKAALRLKLQFGAHCDRYEVRIQLGNKTLFEEGGLA
jgi:hypothetical protein